MSLDAHGSGKICFSTPVRIVTASLSIQPQNSHRPQDDSTVNGSLAGAIPAEQRMASQQQGLVPSGRVNTSATAGLPQLPIGTTARGRPRSGRPQRAAAKPAPVSDLDSEEDEDYEVGEDLQLMRSGCAGCGEARDMTTTHDLRIQLLLSFLVGCAKMSAAPDVLIYVYVQPSPSRQRRPASRSLDNGGHEDGGEQLLAKMKEKNRSAQRRYRERIKVSLASAATKPVFTVMKDAGCMLSECLDWARRISLGRRPLRAMLLVHTLCAAQSRLAESEERVQELTQAVAMLKVQKVTSYLNNSMLLLNCRKV